MHKYKDFTIKNVKITTLRSFSQVFSQVFEAICPCKCAGCGKVGTALCGCCKKYLVKRNAIFREKTEVKEGILVAGMKAGLLEKMTKEFKYDSKRHLARPLAEILNEVLPEDDFVIVPLPTIDKHIRQRGFDHMKLMGAELAKLRGCEMRTLLKRVNSTVQVGATQEKRLAQAKEAYAVDDRGGKVGVGSGKVGLGGSKIDAGRRYLLIDDVTTTGASLRAAEEVLRAAGAKEIYKAVLMAASVDDDMEEKNKLGLAGWTGDNKRWVGDGKKWAGDSRKWTGDGERWAGE